MSLALYEQLSQLLRRAKRPVIVLKATPTVDDFAAAFTVRAYLRKMDKPCDIVTQGGRAPDVLSFLSTSTEVRGDFQNINALTIRVNVDHAHVDELSYAVEGRDLVISVTPKTGAWKNNDVRVACNDYRYDLVFMIGVPDRASIGTLSTTYADFFLRTPTVVVDHGPENEHFGTVNIVDLVATSVSEVCFDLFTRLDPSLVDDGIATALLAGMMSKTKGFRTPNVSPKTLETAQKLMEKGGKREDVVEHLYRTRSVETLRLWGRALARLKSDESLGLVWTLVTRQDFLSAGATEDALRDVVDELFSTSPHATVALVFSETANGHVIAQLHASRPHDALALGAPFRPTGTHSVALLTLHETDIVAAEKAVITHVKGKLKG